MRESPKNLTGMSFGLLSVKAEYKPEEPKKYRLWSVLCSCGKEKTVREDSLLAGRVRSCGCASNRFKKTKMEKRYNLVNKRFGSLWVVWRGESQKVASGSSHSLWVCKCDCGNIVTVKGKDLSSGRVQSCGCVDVTVSDAKFFKKNAEKCGREWCLTDEQFNALVGTACYYCGNTSQNGIDLVSNSLGYTLENTVSCCAICSAMKRFMSPEAFIAHIHRVVEHWSNKKSMETVA